MTIPAGFAQLTWTFGGIAAPLGAATTLGASVDPGLSAQDVADAGVVAWADNLLAQQSDDIVLTSCMAKLGPDDVGPSAVAPSTLAGTIVGTAVEPNTALLVRKVTNVGGRRGRGRMYVPGLDDSKVDAGGNLVTGELALWNTALDAFLNDLIAAQVAPALLHEPATEWVLVNGQPRRVPIGGAVPAPYTIFSLVAQPRVATQRRRLRR